MQYVIYPMHYVMLDQKIDITYVKSTLHKQDQEITEKYKNNNKRDQQAIRERQQ